MLARDLNAAMGMAGAPPRVALLFDTHESFWGAGQLRESQESYHSRDEWLRSFLRALDLEKGIVAVIAGRDLPRWHEAPTDTRIPKDYMDAWLVDHLSPEDTEEYLIKAGVQDSALRHAAISMSQVAAQQIHPLFLDLCGDIVLAAARNNETFAAEDLFKQEKTIDKTRSLIIRLLRYCDQDLAHAIKSLAAARTFNRELFFSLGDAVRYHATNAVFQQVIQFSFVWPIPQQGDGWYCIHAL